MCFSFELTRNANVGRSASILQSNEIYFACLILPNYIPNLVHTLAQGLNVFFAEKLPKIYIRHWLKVVIVLSWPQKHVIVNTNCSFIHSISSKSIYVVINIAQGNWINIRRLHATTAQTECDRLPCIKFSIFLNKSFVDGIGFFLYFVFLEKNSFP